ncbi:hypothetical protein [Enemella dayhoffiae]|uniref:hypothetical protein n=1 Tax=Enemella dayhoffiae TaxID=2016507 RepID=UPI0011403BE7|nr:hypothetical protein [Enemella dayhoffiae]
MVGLIWRLLTDGEAARHGTPDLPVSSRVLFVLANAFFGLLLVLILAGLGGNYPFRPDNVESLGDQHLAHTVLIVAIVLGCAGALPGRGRTVSTGDAHLR